MCKSSQTRQSKTFSKSCSVDWMGRVGQMLPVAHTFIQKYISVQGCGGRAVWLIPHVVFSLKVVEEIQQVEPLKKAEDLIPCPICSKEFPCKSSLDTHMEMHPEASLK